jgi:hypothetical protein
MGTKLFLASVLALVLFAVPCLSLSRIACNNVKQGMDVQGPVSSANILLLDHSFQVAFAPRIRLTGCAM